MEGDAGGAGEDVPLHDLPLLPLQAARHLRQRHRGHRHQGRPHLLRLPGAQSCGPPTRKRAQAYAGVTLITDQMQEEAPKRGLSEERQDGRAEKQKGRFVGVAGKKRCQSDADKQMSAYRQCQVSSAICSKGLDAQAGSGVRMPTSARAERRPHWHTSHVLTAACQYQ